MKHSLTLYYSVQNGGDGSAYPKFMSSKKLTEYDQENMIENGEGWGETCNGSITLESDSPISVKEEVDTPESYLVNLIDNENDNIEDFIKQFFPGGKPKFEVTTRSTNNKDYLYNDVFIDGKKVGECFHSIKDSGKIFEDILNS